MKKFSRILFISVLMGLSGFAYAGTIAHGKVVSASPVTVTAPVNLNTATAKELAAVPGLNPSKIRAILSWRKKNGPFRSFDNLREVSGFKRMKEETLKGIEAQMSIG